MNLKTCFFFLVMICVALQAIGGDFQKGYKGQSAYQKGDYVTALEEWKPLAEQGDAAAQFYLGVMYYYGRGVPQNYNEAVKWYTKAAEQGETPAI